MLQFLSNKSILLVSLLLLLIMFAASSYVNPLIDGKDGYGLVELQLAFDKQAGIDIINNWGAEGLAAYKRYFLVDYVYALSYAFFFASLLAFLLRKKGLETSAYRSVLPFAPLASGCDWLENTMEFLFIQSPPKFPDSLFFIHSIVALLKWASVSIVVISILLILIFHAKKSQSDV